MRSNNQSIMNRVLTLLLLLVAGTAWATSPTKPPAGPDYSVVTYYHNDVAGSPLAATDADRYVIWREEYSPYGERVLRDPAAADNHLWFTGHPHDEDSGLTYAGARHYDPIIGRFMSVDPVPVDAASPYTFNRYAYGNNNPYGYEDPDGREPGDAAFGLSVGLFMKPADARKVQQAEAAIGNSHIASSIETGMALRSARDAASQGATGKEMLAAAAYTFFGMQAQKKEEDPDGDMPRDFDEARRLSFKKAGLTNPDEIEFTQVDEKTGTVTQFTGPGNAKVGYDGPHASPGLHHDKQHISWQAGGKKALGGRERGNIPYTGPRHPSRPSRKNKR